MKRKINKLQKRIDALVNRCIIEMRRTSNIHKHREIAIRYTRLIQKI